MAKARTRDTDAIRAVAKRIRSVDEVSPYVKVGVYGPNGSGKTRFAASGPKCLIVDINEEGTRSTAGQHTGAKKIEVGSWPDIGHIYWMLRALIDKGKNPFQTLALDTTTAMNDLALSFVLDEADERDPGRERRMPDKRHYGRAGELVKGMLMAYRNLPMHVVLTAQVRAIKDDDTGEVLEYAFGLPAGSRAVATGAVSVLGFMEQREIKRRVGGKVKRELVPVTRTQPTDMDGEFPYLKDRTNGLKPFEPKLTMPKIIEAWANKED